VTAAAALVAVLAASLLGGWAGWLYTAAYALAVLPGCIIGTSLFGRTHPAAWVTSALAGYALSSVGLWLLRPFGWLGLIVWVACGVGSLMWSLRSRRALVALPRWRRSSTVALASALIVTTVLVAVPLARVGETDSHGNHRYRAYFTADFVWHEALTAELARAEAAPRNPYVANQPLAYYWGYFVLPSTAVRQVYATSNRAPDVESFLKLNALWTALLFISAAFLAAWVATPRGWPAAVAVLLTVTAASAEGLYAAARTWREASSLEPLRNLNVDAVTYWWFNGLTIDSLARALWYNPQHSAACALGLIALVVIMRTRRLAAPGMTGILTGMLLGGALVMSPFPGGAMALVCGGTIAVRLLARATSLRPGIILGLGMAPAPIAALWWLSHNAMVSGAGQAITFGLSSSAMNRVWQVLSLAIGPLLVLVVLGAAFAVRRGRVIQLGAGFVGVVTALALYFFVTLALEPIWIGWRAGQILQATAPIVIAGALLHLRRDVGRWPLAVVVTLWALVGLPTTVIDAFNAQDTTNETMGPGFRWTVVVTPDEQKSFEWIQRQTERNAVFQMAIVPRGRETWSLIPSFARRRLAAGLPISLLMTDEERTAASRVDGVFSQDDPARAWAIAREFGVQYVFVGRVERETFPRVNDVLAADKNLFQAVFENADVTIYAVRCQSSTPCR
jgi:hypothetical protein